MARATLASGFTIMSSASPIEDLAEQVAVATKTLSEFLRSNGHGQPSFDREAPSTTLPPAAPKEILVARQNLTEAALKLYQLATGPSEYLPRLAVWYQQLACLRWLCRFNVFSLVPLRGWIPYSTVAACAKVPESQLKSIARMAMTNNLFSEPTPNHLAHSATSALLVTNPNFHDWAVFMTDFSVPTAGKLVEATEKWGDSVRKNETAFNIAFDTDRPFFDYLSQFPERTKQFAGYMKSVTNSEGTDIKHLLSGFDWASLGEATVIDIGGSSGHASIALANAHPNLKFIVQDLPAVIANAGASLAHLPSAVASRISFQEHDFFQPEPVKGADVYLLRMILHDWPAKEATTILANIVPALKAGSRIIVMDSVLPAPGKIPATQESLLRVRDLTMMEVFNSRERSLDDWTALLEQADQRLRLSNVVQPFGSMMSAMEIVFDG